MPFKTLGLADRLVQGILATGYTAPTEIQSRVIPLALAGKDIIGTSQTGTGKTAAFVLPILHRLDQRTEAQKSEHHIRALILTPTRELAQQIEDSILRYGRFLHPRTLAIYGGTNMQNQMKHLQRGVDIVISTPGRLLDLLQRRSLNLSKIEVLVVDEADRMFDMGFIQDVRRIVSHLPNNRQTLMFSATISKEVRELMSTIQKHPMLIEIGEQRSPVESVRQSFYSAPREKKMDLLLHMLDSQKMDSVLIFSRTKHGADKISRRLEKRGIKAVAIHSNRTQAQRQRALAGFKQNHYRVLVATDVAARGIDVEGISHVVNYDIPSFPEDYIHRIGRTGRASATGDAITFVGQDEINYLRKLEHFTSKKYELKKYPGFDYAKPSTISPHVQHVKADQPRHPHDHRQRRRGSQESSHHVGQSERHPHGRNLRQNPRYRHQGASNPQPLVFERDGKQPRTHQNSSKDQDWRGLLGEMVETLIGKKRKSRGRSGD